MSDTEPLVQIVHVADTRTLELIRFAVVLAVADEPALRDGAARVARSDVPAEWVEELVLQSYLFVGFPRALNAAREWRRASGISAPAHDEGAEHSRIEDWVVRGERTCEIVYGAMYGKLRQNIRELHPSLDAWMIAEGYGKVLGRHGLDLARRELCIVATCAVLRQERQLHAHLHGALHAGAAREAVNSVLELCGEYLNEDEMDRVRRLWDRVQGGGRE